MNLRDWNQAQWTQPPRFTLPSVYSLRRDLLSAALADIKYFFTSWDVKNFYWSLKATHFRFATQSPAGQLLVWQMDSIPFGWDKACYLGQTVHSQLVDSIPHPPHVQHRLYIDDGLAMGPDPEQLQTYTKDVVDHLQDQGLPISEKSQLTPKLSLGYIGKQYEATQIKNTETRLVKLGQLYLISSAAPYLRHKLLEKIQGSSTYAVCHTSSYASTFYLRQLLQSSKPVIARSMKLQASFCAILATAMVPWKLTGFFSIRVPSSPRIYVDAGPEHVGLVYKLGRVWYQCSMPLPSKLLNIKHRQQSAELYGILCAIKLCLSHGIINPEMVMDSTSTFGAIIKGSTSYHNERGPTLMKIQYLMLKYQLRVYVALINTKLHPADIPSRIISADISAKRSLPLLKSKLSWIILKLIQLSYIMTSPPLNQIHHLELGLHHNG